MTADRRNLWLLMGCWLLASVLMTLASYQSLIERQFPDPDDVMRLLQVRDWIGGQGWFDLTQHRLNPPEGVPMHWSRLVDIPIAAVILAVRPVLGEYSAETTALVIVPLVTLGVAMLVVQRIGLKLMGKGTALLAACATPFSLGALKQMRPMRIDHHGWQIVLALVGMLAAMDEKPRRSGIIAGIAMAMWMDISIEGLPFAAAFGVLFGWQWLLDSSATERLKSYLGALAVSSIFLFGIMHAPATWVSQPRDVVTPADLAAFTVAALVSAVAVRADIGRFPARVGVLGLAGGLTLATIFIVDPHWLIGPFGSLDPLVKQFWYDSVEEGLPVWRIGWATSAVGLSQPLVGLIGAAVAIRSTSGRERNLWATYAFLLFALTLGGVFVIRTETTASIIGLPGTAFLCTLVFRRARTVSLMPARVVASAGAICIMTPAYAVPLTVVPHNGRVQKAAEQWNACTAKSQIDKLQMLPTGFIAAPLDITPEILIATQHRALATGHHRNVTGMRDDIRLFVFPLPEAAAIIARRQIDYVVFCPGATEAIRYAYHDPNDLSSRLIAGQAPDWLERLNLPGLRGLQVWRVRKDVAAAEARA